jgi:hypothetical protein
VQGDPGTAKSQFLKFVEKVAPIGTALMTTQRSSLPISSMPGYSGIAHTSFVTPSSQLCIPLARAAVLLVSRLP